MKKRLLWIFIAFLLMALLPLLALGSVGGVNRAVSPTEDSAKRNKESIAEERNVGQSQEIDCFRILDTSTGTVVTVEERAFCLGATAYEMPPGYEKEALKAQCVACYTHFCRLRRQQREHPDDELKGADFSADLSHNQFYFSDRALRDKWGSLYEQCYQHLQEAVNECFGITLQDKDGSLPDIAYFALSSGRTESARDVFGFDSPYLQPQASPFDCLATDYLTVRSFSADEVKTILTKHDSTLQLGKEPAKWLGKTERTDSGSVKIMEIGSGSFSGNDLRTLFDLRSAHFTLTYDGKRFVFEVKGYGHGVGMSQYGANEMAKQGAGFREILQHYYGGVIFSDQREDS